ncbi:secreted RxLR effector protein 161-like [Salvia hispanica]|uniref:secreted RxLR effector protein 161-like n=1 Tax=Salvia hispanica TaxID=49212 RepID=UPI002008FCF4|nr:secreted RxLR effector protein 161-like [Salvia hispanica]
MHDAKAVSTPLSAHFKLSMDQRPKDDGERRDLSKIPYTNIIGSIMYTMLCTRPDLAQAISVTSRFRSDHGREHWIALKWLLRYLKGAAKYGLVYRAGIDQQGEALIGFCDSDYASNRNNRRSQTGYIFNLYGTAISWKSGLQHVVALSTTEAEYIVITEAVKEGKWLKGILEDFGEKQSTLDIFCDSSSALALTKHQVFHERSKQIDAKLHLDEVQKGEVRMLKISTDHNAADMLTKPLPTVKFKYCQELVGLRE